MQKKYIGLLCSITISIIGIIFLMGINGNRSDSSEKITRYHWIEMLCEHYGMVEYKNEESYFPDVNSSDLYFAYVQSACEWDVIEKNIEFRGDDLATGEFIVVTAIKSLGNSKCQTLFDSDRVLSDDELVELAVKNDIISNSDLEKNFTVRKCSDVLDKIDELNYGKIFSENYTEIILKDGIEEISNSDIQSHNDDYSEVTVSREIIEKLDYNNAIILEDEKGLKFTKRIVDIGEESVVLGDNVDISDVLEQLVSYESHEIYFEDIVNYYGFDDSEKVIASLSPNRKYTATQLNSKKKNKGFKLAINSEEDEAIEIVITDNATEDSYVLPMPKEIELGVAFNAEVDVQKIICAPYVDYNALDGVRYAEVALDIESVMSGELGFEIPEIEPIPLFTFTIPLANGFAQIDVQIYMQIEADGSISFSAKVPIQSSVCYEKGKGVRRVNREVAFEEPTIHANCSLEAGVHFQPILTILKSLEVMEAQLEVGITAEAEAVTYINEQTCVDVNSAYPIVSISIGADEDRKNVLTMLDLSKKWEIVSADEAPFQLHIHWESLVDGKEQFVDKCTYKGEKEEKRQEKKLSVKNNFDNTYYTKYSEYNQCDRPTFCFDYPDNWRIIKDEVEEVIEERSYGNYYGEIVELRNEAGMVITYTQWEVEPSSLGAGSAFDYIIDYEVEKVCDANIIPSDLWKMESAQKYMVAKIIEKGCTNPDGEYSEYNTVLYAIVPEDILLEGSVDMVGFQDVTAFNYSTPYSFVASSLDGKLTEENEHEIIQILSSFRLVDGEDIAKETEIDFESGTEESSNEICSKLEGIWKFKDYTYKGKSSKYTDGIVTLEIVDTDGTLCMIEKTYRNNEFYSDSMVLYDVSCIDEFNYKAYVYKKGVYNGNEKANWGDDILQVWYTFNLQNVSKGELIVSYHMSFENGYVDNNHVFLYQKDE